MHYWPLAAFLFFAPLTAEIAGNYSIHGNDPLSNPYTGTATISKEGEAFTAYWYYDDGTSEMGTGIHIGNQVAFIYEGNQAPKHMGVVSYRIVQNALIGQWIPLNESTPGTETLRPN